ncbi:MAG: twin-arginine translocase subunit TatC [Candidatus Nomurabacteria bacterium]|nr:twin-arginine translocase subunit TatC [Candidatus Nomurabacteria bacterium]
MTILDELKKFFKNIMYWVFSFLGFSILFFSFGLKNVVLFGKNLILPLPAENSFSVIIFNKIQTDLLPPNVHLVVTDFLSGFTAQIILSLLLAFIITFPFLLYRVIKYLSPALFEHEKKAILKAILPSSFLFFIGCAFAYYFVIPMTFKILFPYATIISATPFFSVDQFISSIVSLMFAVGIMFLLPLLMILLSFLGIVDGAFWQNKWRHMLLFFTILTAIITPDGTGVTMIILLVPMVLLYSIGCIFTNKFKKVELIELTK